MSDWISFYDMRHSLIYVNARHRDVHYRKIADDIRALVQKPSAAVLDYGCGEATAADHLAQACGHLTMVEAAPNVRAALSARYAGNRKISVLTPDAAAAWSLLKCGGANGFFWAAVGGLLRIFVSDYLRLKKTVGLSHYEPHAMLEKLKAAGYSAQRPTRNIGHNQRRMTFLARAK